VNQSENSGASSSIPELDRLLSASKKGFERDVKRIVPIVVAKLSSSGRAGSGMRAAACVDEIRPVYEQAVDEFLRIATAFAVRRQLDEPTVSAPVRIYAIQLSLLAQQLIEKSYGDIQPSMRNLAATLMLELRERAVTAIEQFELGVHPRYSIAPLGEEGRPAPSYSFGNVSGSVAIASGDVEQHVHNTTTIDQLRVAVSEFDPNPMRGVIAADEFRRLESTISNLKRELTNHQPNKSIVEQGLQSLRSISESILGAAAAEPLFSLVRMLSHFVGV